MTKLSVNINKIATLRNARGGNVPDLCAAAVAIQSFGAHGITIHPRPDERHVRRQDVYALRQVVHKELNIEGYPSPDFCALIKEVHPEQCTLVPDPPHVLTSDAGWQVTANRGLLTQVADELREVTRLSVFMDPLTTTDQDLQLLAQMGVARIEMYTERYARFFASPEKDAVLATYRTLAKKAQAYGLEVNAGHDLDQHNLGLFTKEIKGIAEVSIGHALISEALYLGLATTVERYLQILLNSSQKA